ncbi:hypothetical protein FACS1894102_2580 [Spirochaetia bacterium]|nr:hypothetical protein FACS1894102_2580 [Spirochaetia bacterium]
MTNKNKFLALALFAAITVCAFAQDESQAGETTVKGRLLKASYAGRDTTSLYEPIVTIRQSETLGVSYLTFELEGARSARNSKTYEFYNDGSANSPLIWKRRMRGVVVDPITVYIATTPGATDSTNNLLISYEYTDSKGFGTVSYVVSLEK